MSNKEVKSLEQVAEKVRFHILKMSYSAQSAHTGGALSVVEILTALYFSVLHADPKTPDSPNRDRLIFSKAHDAKALYATLALRGYFPLSYLDTYEKDNGYLAGHTIRFSVPGVEYSAGSLGHGLPIAVGVALAAKKQKKRHSVYAVLSDGECDEGTTWESALLASHHKLDNLTVIIDCNHLQGFGRTEKVLNLEPLKSKWKSFGFTVLSVNGHSFPELLKAFRKKKESQKPTVILAETIKGKGGVFKHVNQISSQYKAPTKEEFLSLYPNGL